MILDAMPRTSEQTAFEAMFQKWVAMTGREYPCGCNLHNSWWTGYCPTANELFREGNILNHKSGGAGEYFWRYIDKRHELINHLSVQCEQITEA